MTIPDERALAIMQTRRFLIELINPKDTRRVPSEIRFRARGLLKHYPHQAVPKGRKVECE